MQIEEKSVDNLLIVKPLEGRMDFKMANDFKERMAKFIIGGNMFIILNLSQVEFIDSSGLGAIVYSLKRMGGRGDLFICGVKETIMTMFNLTRMDKVFRIFDTEEEAVKALLSKDG
jgi:anti-sigma B factor antagonist